jgi:hypothetical protein
LVVDKLNQVKKVFRKKLWLCQGKSVRLAYYFWNFETSQGKSGEIILDKVECDDILNWSRNPESQTCDQDRMDPG